VGFAIVGTTGFVVVGTTGFVVVGTTGFVVVRTTGFVVVGPTGCVVVGPIGFAGVDPWVAAGVVLRGAPADPPPVGFAGATVLAGADVFVLESLSAEWAKTNKARGTARYPADNILHIPCTLIEKYLQIFILRER
jgi:hypothetical protein